MRTSENRTTEIRRSQGPSVMTWLPNIFYRWTEFQKFLDFKAFINKIVLIDCFQKDGTPCMYIVPILATEQCKAIKTSL